MYPGQAAGEALQVPVMEYNMELSAKRSSHSHGVASGLMKKWARDENLSDECRHLVRVLERKIHALCEEEAGNYDEISRIRSLVPTLSAMGDLLHEIKPRANSVISLDDFMQDDRGFTYVSVRNSELERFSAK